MLDISYLSDKQREARTHIVIELHNLVDEDETKLYIVFAGSYMECKLVADHHTNSYTINPCYSVDYTVCKWGE